MQRFDEIYAQHADAVRAYVRRRAPESLVDDVVPDVFVVALRRIDDVPSNGAPVSVRRCSEDARERAAQARNRGSPRTLRPLRPFDPNREE